MAKPSEKPERNGEVRTDPDGKKYWHSFATNKKELVVVEPVEVKPEPKKKKAKGS